MKKAPGKAMQLGKAKKQTELVKEMVLVKQEEAKEEEVNPLAENVVVEIEERVNCQLNKDGELNKFEVKGVIYMTLTDPKKNNPRI